MVFIGRRSRLSHFVAGSVPRQKTHFAKKAQMKSATALNLDIQSTGRHCGVLKDCYQSMDEFVKMNAGRFERAWTLPRAAVAGQFASRLGKRNTDGMAITFLLRRLFPRDWRPVSPPIASPDGTMFAIPMINYCIAKRSLGRFVTFEVRNERYEFMHAIQSGVAASEHWEISWRNNNTVVVTGSRSGEGYVWESTALLSAAVSSLSWMSVQAISKLTHYQSASRSTSVAFSKQTLDSIVR